MKFTRNKNTVRYYLTIVIILAFLFFTSDFGLIDIQKTAIVMAVGVDREDDTFIITSQIAIPQSSKQGKQSETVQLVSRGTTVAAAFEEINNKTGWYPKLVFCQLLILGEKAVEKNAFDALDFFLLDEYMSDNCLVATCDGLASELLNVTALVDPAVSVAIQKVLSPHAQRVGTVLPSTLREFAIGYYADNKSGFLPIVKTEPQQEHVNGKSQNGAQKSGTENSSGGGQDAQPQAQSGQSQGQSQQSKSGDKPVFSAGETALFVGGKRVGTLTREETFAFNTIKHDIQLATYTVNGENQSCSLTVKHNEKQRKVTLGKDERPTLKLRVTMTAGLLDCSDALKIENATDAGDVPLGVFPIAEEQLKTQITTAFEKCRACGCDLFGIGDALQKYKPNAYEKIKDYALQNTLLTVDVRFRNIR